MAMCHSREQAEQVKASLTAWLEPRGLRFNEDKTRIVHVEDGFSFLGFDIRRHVDRQGSGKLLIAFYRLLHAHSRRQILARRAVHQP
ncbi:hypothetical protein ACIQU6_44955 [Streptomyces sp. NPDC090442]|uniref:hypothetical protein n=1 Tax=Streptomyces sp. NPDC090442 TaxID=3365962 RepID=UPI0037F334C8